jgi:lysophospholipase L1-like esterase
MLRAGIFKKSAAFLVALLLLVSVVFGAVAEPIADGTQVATRTGFVGRMGPPKAGRPTIINFRPGPTGNMAAWSAAKAAMAIGLHPKVLYVGDSKTMGYNVLNTGYVGASASSITKKIADICNAAGLAVNKDIIFSHQGPTSISLQAGYDPRINTPITSWAFGSDTGISGNAWREGSPNTDNLSFTFAGTDDRVTIWYIQRTANQDSFVVTDSSTVVGTVNTVGTPSAFVSVTLSLASRAANHTISIARAGLVSQAIVIQGLVLWDSTTPAIDIYNVGRFGTKASAEWQSNSLPWSALNAIQTIAPNLTVISLGSNDLLGLVDVPTFTASIQTLINAAKAGGGSVVLVNPTKGQQPAYGDATAQVAYSAALLQLAYANDVPLIDEGGVFVDYNTANAKGLFASGDPIHENSPGTDVRAVLHARVFLEN